jgi:large subunit ribosomal protein L18e
MHRRGTTNIQLKKLTDSLSKQKKGLWKRLAEDLSRPTRIRREVNISRINRFAKKGEIIAVPGKVLSDGNIKHSVTVAAFSFSKSAKEKIEKAGGKAISLSDLVSKHPDAKGVKLLG